MEYVYLILRGVVQIMEDEKVKKEKMDWVNDTYKLINKGSKAPAGQRKVVVINKKKDGKVEVKIDNLVIENASNWNVRDTQGTDESGDLGNMGI